MSVRNTLRQPKNNRLGAFLEFRQVCAALEDYHRVHGKEKVKSNLRGVQ